MAPFDASSYKKEVLIPWSTDQGMAAQLQSALSGLQADRSNTGYLKLDLFVLFALSEGLYTRDALEAHSAELDKVYNKAAKVFPAAAQLKRLKVLLTENGNFLDPGFWSGLGRQRAQVLEQALKQAVRALSSEAPLGVMSLSEATARLEAFGLDGLDTAVRDRALQGAGITVFPDIEIPEVAEFAALRGPWERTSEHVRFRTIFDLMMYGSKDPVRNAQFLDAFSVDGVPVHTADVMLAHKRSLSVRDSDESQAAQKFLGQLIRITDREALRRIALITLWHLVQDQVGRHVPLVTIVERLVADGIDEFDARRLVASVGTSTAPAPMVLGPDTVRERLAGGDLAGARRTLAALPDDSGTTDERRELANRIDELQRRKEAAVAAYRQALAEGRLDAAAGYLDTARETDRTDPTLEDLALQLPPPVPRVTAQPTADGVRVEWNRVEPDAEYTLLRTTQVDAHGVPVHAVVVTEGLRARVFDDRQAPMGSVVHYAVRAARPRGAMSDAGWCSVEVFPPPANLQVRASESSIDLTWEMPTGARETRIDVVDRDGRQMRHRTSAPSWRLDGLVPGRSQHITLRAVYLTDEGPRESAATSTDATPQAAARPVDDLFLEPADDGAALIAHWSAPSGLAAELWTFPRGARVEYGSLLLPGDARARGGNPVRVRLVQATATATTAEIDLPGTVCQIVAMLVTDRGLLVGRAVPAGAASPVTNARVEEFADQLRLTWDWPDGDVLAEVQWQTPVGDRVRRVTPARYRSEGGVYLPERHAIGDIGIQTIARVDGEEWRSQRIVLSRPRPAQALVSYTASISRSFAGRTKVSLTLTCDQPVTGQSFGLYLTGGATLPMGPDPAVCVQHFTVDFAATNPHVATMELGRLKGPFWIRVFADDRHRTRVVDPPTPQLRG